MTGNKPPMALAARQGYLAHDIHRMADWAGGFLSLFLLISC